MVSRVWRLVMRVGLVLVFLMLLTTPARAQNADLKHLWREVTSGDVVRVKEASGLETRGVFTKLSETAVGVTVGGKSIEIPTASIREIRRRGDSPVGGIFAGAAIGGGAALTLFYLCRDLTTPACMGMTKGTIVGAAVGAGLGAFVDSAVRGWTVAFRDNGTSFVLAPAVQPTPHGVTASVRITFPGGS